MEPSEHREFDRRAGSASSVPIVPYRDRKYFRVGDGVCELDQVIVRDEEWPGLPESLDPGWMIFRRDGFIFASRILA